MLSKYTKIHIILYRYTHIHVYIKNIKIIFLHISKISSTILNYVTKSRPLPAIGMNSQAPEYARSTHDHRNFSGPNDLNRHGSPTRPTYHEGSSLRNIGNYY